MRVCPADENKAENEAKYCLFLVRCGSVAATSTSTVLYPMSDVGTSLVRRAHDRFDLVIEHMVWR